MAVTESQQGFIQQLEDTFAQANIDFARAYYLFATAKLKETYNSSEIYAKYPMLSDEATFKQLKPVYDDSKDDETVRRLFKDVLDSYIGNQLSAKSDEFENIKNKLTVHVADLGLTDKDGNAVSELLYEDIPQYLKSVADKPTRESLHTRMNEAYTREMTPRFIALMRDKIGLLAEQGYSDVIGFYTELNGHNLMRLGDNAKTLLEETESLYRSHMAEYYTQRTGLPFEQATRADISYVFYGPNESLVDIEAKFPAANLVAAAEKTFDGMGVEFSSVASTVDFQSLNEYDASLNDPNAPSRRILLDIAPRSGKRSRAYVYPSRIPSEVYLSVKPEGGLDDYLAFFHESGHALHFAYESELLPYSLALMGNNSVTECYAYLMQNLLLNRHWLQHVIGLTLDEATRSVKKAALIDLYMLRRYASKMRFELELFSQPSLPESHLAQVAATYEQLLTSGTGFAYQPEEWTRDVDSGFYVADYFTAWTLEAQLRDYLMSHFGSEATGGEDWYQNPEAGRFLKTLWEQGNLNPDNLSRKLGYPDPNDVRPLMALMKRNLTLQ